MSFWCTDGAQQQTLARPAEVSGRGLFHGCEADVRLLPAKADSGIVFRRTDLRGCPEVMAHVDCVVPAARRTVIAAANGARVETIEHLMAALAGLQVDNCIVEINANEVPAVDGSCLPFCHAVLNAGLRPLAAPRRTITITESHRIADQGRAEWVELIPLGNAALSVNYRLDYGLESVIPAQAFSFEFTSADFVNQIAPARTFVLAEEIEGLRAMGFGRHLTGRDLVVFDSAGNVVDNTLRWADEPVRHKVLDCIGDLALCGHSLRGGVVARRSGHKLNHVVAKILSTAHTQPVVRRRAA